MSSDTEPRLDVSALTAPGPDISGKVPYRAPATALLMYEEHTERKPGRPSDLKPFVLAGIIEALESGASIDEAADAVGQGRRTVHRWREMGRKSKSLDDFRQFWQLTEIARARYRRTLEHVVNRGAIEDPKLALKVLERRFPAEWRLRIAIESEETPGATRAREVLESKISQIERRLSAGDVASTVPESPAAKAEREAAEDE